MSFSEVLFLVSVFDGAPRWRYCSLGHLKKTEVLIFGAALGFFHYLVHLMPIGIILSEID